MPVLAGPTRSRTACPVTISAPWATPQAELVTTTSRSATAGRIGLLCCLGRGSRRRWAWVGSTCTGRCHRRRCANDRAADVREELDVGVHGVARQVDRAASPLLQLDAAADAAAGDAHAFRVLGLDVAVDANAGRDQGCVPVDLHVAVDARAVEPAGRAARHADVDVEATRADRAATCSLVVRRGRSGGRWAEQAACTEGG